MSVKQCADAVRQQLEYEREISKSNFCVRLGIKWCDNPLLDDSELSDTFTCPVCGTVWSIQATGDEDNPFEWEAQ